MITERYRKLLDEHLGRVPARVRTAVSLTESGGIVLDGSLEGQLERIRRRLGTA